MELHQMTPPLPHQAGLTQFSLRRNTLCCQRQSLFSAPKDTVCSAWLLHAQLTACSCVLLLGTALRPAAACSAAREAALLVPPAASHDSQMPTASLTVRLHAAKTGRQASALSSAG
jgi:hypothetical protein